MGNMEVDIIIINRVMRVVDMEIIICHQQIRLKINT